MRADKPDRTASEDRWWDVSTPIGWLVLWGNESALHELLLPNQADQERRTAAPEMRGRPGAVALAEEQILEYFGSGRRHFEVPLDPRGSVWQRAVWSALSEIPYGATASYSEIACRVGNPNASRAVGLANARNPIALIIPCHRVIGKEGRLVGYGGGLGLKAQLLAHERSQLTLPLAPLMLAP